MSTTASGPARRTTAELEALPLAPPAATGLSEVVRRRYLDDVQRHHRRLQDDGPHRSEQVGGVHPAGLGSAGARRETRVEDVDVDRQVQPVAAVARPGDGVRDILRVAALLAPYRRARL